MTYVFQNLHWFILLIGALVFFHELGHFLVAKACGIKVLRFSLGFGPRLFTFTKGETEYSLSLLPLGGYVKMLGDVPGAEIPPEEATRAFSNKPVWQRTLVVAAGPVANFVLSTVVYFSMFLGAHTFGDTRLGIVTQGEPAWQAGMRPGDKIMAIDGEPITRWEELREAIATHPDADLSVTYERNGVSKTVALQTGARQEENAFREQESRGKIGVSLQYLRPVLGIIDSHSPAALAGVKTGDVVTEIGGHPIMSWHEVRDAVAALPQGSPVAFTYNRGDDAPKTVSFQPSAQKPEGLDSALFSAADAPWGYTGLTNKDTVVQTVEAGSPAAGAGLQPGDRLLGLSIRAPDGKESHRPIGVWGVDLVAFGLEQQADLVVTYQREDKVMSQAFHLAKHQERDEFKNMRTTYVFGATNDADILDTYTFERQVGALEALTESFGQVHDDMTLIGRGLAKMIGGALPLNTMGGPIMLFVIAEKSAKRGATYFLRTLAMISVNLGMINLLPVPVLDGGHLLFFGIEVVSRRPPSVRVREVANMVGLALLLLLMVLVFRNDVLRFVLD